MIFIRPLLKSGFLMMMIILPVRPADALNGDLPVARGGNAAK